MVEHMSVGHIPGYAMHSGPVAQTRPEVMGIPAIQWPIDDTMPVKAWVFERQPEAQHPFKPLRPEVERKAIEAINRHLPPWDQIRVPQRSHTSAGLALRSAQRLHPETRHNHISTELVLHQRQRLNPEPHHHDHDRNRNEATKRWGSPKPVKPDQGAARGSVSMTWTEMEDEKDGNAWTVGRKSNALVVAAPDLTVTCSDGKTRRLEHQNQYVRGNEGGRGE